MIPEREREALMRLTMCAREECFMCKYQGDCNFDFQYELATKNMNILADALRKTESTISKMEQVDEPQMGDAKPIPLSNRVTHIKDEPKTQMKTQNSNLTFEKRTMRDCYNCKRYETEGECIECHFEPKDEPQTDSLVIKKDTIPKEKLTHKDCGSCKFHDWEWDDFIGFRNICNASDTDTCPTPKYEPQFDKDINVRSKDEPQTDIHDLTDCDFCKDRNCKDCEGGKDEPQTDTEIAKEIVHKMIDDAVIAEDAYSDLRQKMHDAVDEYEPQTERSE